MSHLTEKTWVPLGLAISAIGGGAMWLTTLWMQTNATAATVAELKAKQSSVELIQTDIAVIKFKLESIEKKLDHRGE